MSIPTCNSPVTLVDFFENNSLTNQIKCPGRYYYYFGKERETGEEELRDREKAKEVFAEVKKEVERCIKFVKQRREEDPYRPLLPRLHYHLKHGLLTKVPTFPF
uniref:Uncharacterized protein n=1 Tax=Brassica oleracea var. oleracea TaxID=109376 RepID=A0A0D3DK10_BRAOL